MKYYDKLHSRLIWIQEQATPEFWDEHWAAEQLKNHAKAAKYDHFILGITKKYLTAGKILEGGCGIGGKVYTLHHNGYDAYGVDFGIATVKEINTSIPELKVSLADVRHLPFRSSSFDGYWSLGVIEHFYVGYEDIADEMERVLKPEGILFLTFPYMSPLRRLKVKLGFYPQWDSSIGTKSFYAFVLDKKEVIRAFEVRGFQLMETNPYSGLKGFKDEIQIVKPFLQRLHDYSGKSTLINVIRYALGRTLEKFASHMILLVLKKTEKSKGREP